jgi:hypothetical protein
MKTPFETYLEQVVAQTLQNGGTASKPSTCEFLPILDLWSFPKYPAKTAILPPSVNLLDELRSFIAQNETWLNEDDCWLGTWVNPQTGEYYLDIATGIESLEEAREIASRVGKADGREIVAMFNPKRNQTIFLSS